MSGPYSRLSGLLFFLFYYSSAVLGFVFLYAPFLPLLLLNRCLYRRVTDVLFAVWEAFIVSLLDIVLGVRLRISGDQIRTDESSLIVSNHRSPVDMAFLWAALFHAGNPAASTNTKVVIKEELRQMPGIGWAMQMCRHVFIAQDWKRDESKMGRMIDYLSIDRDQPFQLTLFPEGVHLCKESIAKSDSFARKNNLKAFFKHLLHPRTTGFAFVVEKMRENRRLDAVYDVTIAYADRVPANERAFLDGDFPEEIHFHIKRHTAQMIPTTIVGLEKWLQELWREKEKSLESFHQEGVKFQQRQPSNSKPIQQRILPLQYLSLVAWIYFVYWTLANLVFSLCGLSWILVVVVFMFVVSKHTGGLQEVEVVLERHGSVKGLWRLLRGNDNEEKKKEQ